MTNGAISWPKRPRPPAPELEVSDSIVDNAISCECAIDGLLITESAAHDSNETEALEAFAHDQCRNELR
jgi:hypothetical protein